MRLDRYGSAIEFLAAAGPWLERREAEHNLILGIASTLRDHPALYPATPFLATVSHDGTLVAAALRTPPFNLVLSEIEDEQALDLLVANLDGAELPGLVARPDVATAFADRWVTAHGGRWEIAMEERIYQLSAVVPPRPVPGRAREAMDANRPLIVEWLAAFGREALGDDDATRVATQVDQWLAGKGRRLWLWDDDGPRSLAAAGGETPNGTRIGPVYTPPAERGHGYASALVAAVSQAQLDAGRRFCFLYADLANPTSNKIYQAIGYRPVTDALRIDFGS
jgi:hypothetical protein